MRQPVVDTLRLSDTLRKVGMEREQAEGVARALGKELGEHVAVQGDLDTGFRGVRSEMALMRSELEARIEEVRSSLDAKIEGVRSDLKALNAKFNFGFGLLVAFLSVLVGIGLLNLNKPITAPPGTANAPHTAPASAALEPHPNPATPMIRDAAPVEPGPVPLTPH